MSAGGNYRTTADCFVHDPATNRIRYEGRTEYTTPYYPSGRCSYCISNTP